MKLPKFRQNYIVYYIVEEIIVDFSDVCINGIWWNILEIKENIVLYASVDGVASAYVSEVDGFK